MLTLFLMYGTPRSSGPRPEIKLSGLMPLGKSSAMRMIWGRLMSTTPLRCARISVPAWQSPFGCNCFDLYLAACNSFQRVLALQLRVVYSALPSICCLNILTAGGRNSGSGASILPGRCRQTTLQQCRI